MPNYVSLDAAASVLSRSDRVTVVGCSGGGKTTLAARISATFGLEHICHDRDIHWLPGWTERDRGERRKLTERLIARDRWVMDGTTVSTFDVRLPRSDLVIWVRVPRRVALWGLTKRVIVNYGQVRPDMAEGCPEQLPDREFLSYIWNFERRQSPRIIKALDCHGPKVPVAITRSYQDADQLFNIPA